MFQGGVKKLIYTSTASVIFEGKSLFNVDESTPYPKKHFDPYNHTKELAERKVLSANGDKLLTCSLRPSGLFGPRDAQAWPGFIAAGKEGKSKFQLGDGKNLFDWTYVENVAYAHILASDQLAVGNPCCGQAYFITNDEHTPFWDMFKFVCEGFGFPQPRFHIPLIVAWLMSLLFVMIAKLISPLVKYEPTFTPLRVVNATCTKTFNIQKAKDQLGYKPIIPLKEGMQKTLIFFKRQEDELKKTKIS